MRFQVDGKSYRIGFEHHKPIQFLNEDREATFVNIFEEGEMEIRDENTVPTPKLTLVGNGMAVCNSVDVYSKRKGRKVALINYFREVNKGVEDLLPDVAWVVSKETRTRFWKEYFEWASM